MFSLFMDSFNRRHPPLSAAEESNKYTLTPTDASLEDNPQHAVVEQRRNAVYFPQPPVQFSGLRQTDMTSVSLDECHTCCLSTDECICRLWGDESVSRLGIQPQDSRSWIVDWHHGPFDQVTADTKGFEPTRREEYTSDLYQTIPLLGDWGDSLANQSTSTSDEHRSWDQLQESSEDTVSGPLRQKKPTLCTRLQSYRDIRLGVEERWAMQAGSLVISIDPSFTLLESERRFDEFEIASGDVYILCHLYADLWAFCYKLPLTPDRERRSGTVFAAESRRFGFLPLCAVTLVANFGAFGRRCCEYVENLMAVDSRYPGNGLPVMPPPRSHSLNGSRQIFRGPKTALLPLNMVNEALANPALDENTDFVPLDSTLEQVLAQIGCRRRIWHLKIVPIQKIRAAARLYREKSTYLSSSRAESSDAELNGHDRRYYRRKERGSSSSASEKLKYLFRLS